MIEKLQNIPIAVGPPNAHFTALAAPACLSDLLKGLGPARAPAKGAAVTQSRDGRGLCARDKPDSPWATDAEAGTSEVICSSEAFSRLTLE